MSLLSRCFISCSSAEFRAYRMELREHLTFGYSKPVIQEDFPPAPATLLQKLDDFLFQATVVVHLVGESAGSKPVPAEVDAILSRHAELRDLLPELAERSPGGESPFSYTQWECYLACLHQVPCLVFLADKGSKREEKWKSSTDETESQDEHVRRLRQWGRETTSYVFRDARDIADKVKNAALCEVSEPTIGRQIEEDCWPTIADAERPIPRMANRHDCIGDYVGLISRGSSKRILTIEGPTGHGKSLLIRQLERQTEVSPQVACCRIDFKGGETLRECLSAAVSGLCGEVRFQQFDRVQSDLKDDTCKTAFLNGLQHCRRPVVLLFDTYESASADTRTWFENQLLPFVSKIATVRVVIAGRKTPDLSNVPEFASCHRLAPITDHRHWCTYLRHIVGVTNIPDDHVETMVRAANGNPSVLDSLLSNLTNDSINEI